MGSKLSSHVRHNVIGYLALFFALTGSAVGATAVLKVGDSAGGDLAGTYPNPTIRDGAVTGGTLGKVADNSITGADVNESTLSGVPPGGAAGGDLTGTYPNPTIAGGVVGTGNFSRTIPAVRVDFTPQVEMQHATQRTFPFEVESYDTASLHSTSVDNTRLTAPVTGVYILTADVHWPFDPNGTRFVAIRMNGFEDLATDITGASPVDDTEQTLATAARLEAGDYVELRGFQNSTSTIFAIPRSFTMSWVAPG